MQDRVNKPIPQPALQHHSITHPRQPPTISAPILTKNS
jgi:hypothetical protein